MKTIILRKEDFASEELWNTLIMDDFGQCDEKGMVDAEEIHLKVIDAELDPVY